MLLAFVNLLVSAKITNSGELIFIILWAEIISTISHRMRVSSPDKMKLRLFDFIAALAHILAVSRPGSYPERKPYPNPKSQARTPLLLFAQCRDLAPHLPCSTRAVGAKAASTCGLPGMAAATTTAIAMVMRQACGRSPSTQPSTTAGLLCTMRVVLPPWHPPSAMGGRGIPRLAW